MIKKLRRKFIIIAMISIVTVLFLILGIINIANYNSVNVRADNTLSILIDNGGKFPKEDKVMGEPKPLPNGISPEAPFETRYFSVFLDKGGKVYGVDTGYIAAVSTEKALELAEKAYSSGKRTGFYDDYKYTSVEYKEGSLIVFLDCGRSLGTFRTFLTISVFVSIIGIALVYILVFVLSKIAVRPMLESYEKQKRFITDASHEIKTPLTIIGANTEVMEMENGETKWTLSTKEQINRLTELTNYLIALSRMDEGEGQRLKTDFSLSNAILEVAEPFMSLAKIENKLIDMEIERDISYWGDEKAIRQLVSILLDNAIKYSDKGGSIKVVLRRNGRRNELSIYNSVEYIIPGDHIEFFDRFYRGDASRNSSSKGYGIGLSLAKSIIESHKGKITARSEDEKSLIVLVTL